MMPGEGVGESSEKIGNFTDKKKCVNNCREKRKTDSKVNGVMIGTGEADKGCWCVTSMTGRGDNSKFKSCMLGE